MGRSSLHRHFSISLRGVKGTQYRVPKRYCTACTVTHPTILCTSAHMYARFGGVWQRARVSRMALPMMT